MPDKTKDPRQMNPGDVIRALKEQGVNNLDELVRQSLDAIKKNPDDLEAAKAWTFITGDFVYKYQD